MNQSKSFLQISSSEALDLRDLLILAQSYKSGSINENFKGSGKTGAFLFFEPSTRTRMSFEIAANRLGLRVVNLEGSKGTSLEKGETLLDTVLNVAAMKPDFLVIRCGDELDLKAVQSKLRIPVLNAGWGKVEHPSQALLDVFTLQEKWGDLKGKRILILGDSRYSRVVGSHVELARKLGYEIKYFGPSEVLREASDFKSLSQALEWADAVMALRMQKERHQDRVDYSSQFSLSPATLKHLKPEGWILHPGPMNYGVEVFDGILDEPRSLILTQVENGVYVRMAMMAKVLKEL